MQGSKSRMSLQRSPQQHVRVNRRPPESRAGQGPDTGVLSALNSAPSRRPRCRSRTSTLRAVATHVLAPRVRTNGTHRHGTTGAFAQSPSPINRIRGVGQTAPGSSLSVLLVLPYALPGCSPGSARPRRSRPLILYLVGVAWFELRCYRRPRRP